MARLLIQGHRLKGASRSLLHFFRLGLETTESREMEVLYHHQFLGWMNKYYCVVCHLCFYGYGG